MTMQEKIEGALSPTVAWTGSRYVDVLNPQPEDMILFEIATGLARESRYGGSATCVPWSVCQHSLLVLHQMKADGVADIATLRCGLMHDAPEYVIGDLISPVKGACPEYRGIEAKWWWAISTRFGLPPELPEAVKYYDLLALSTEKASLISSMAGPWPALPDPGVIPLELLRLGEKEARRRFLIEARGMGIGD